MPNKIKYRRHRYVKLLAALFSLILCVTAYGQQNSTIEGSVVDAKGGALPGAQITLTQNGTGFVTNGVSNASGLFSFPALNVGTYDLTVTSRLTRPPVLSSTFQRPCVTT